MPVEIRTNEVVIVEGGRATTPRGGGPLVPCPKCNVGRLHRATIRLWKGRRTSPRWWTTKWLICDNPECEYARDESGRWSLVRRSK